jgi:hypothetical protein
MLVFFVNLVNSRKRIIEERIECPKSGLSRLREDGWLGFTMNQSEWKKGKQD